MSHSPILGKEQPCSNPRCPLVGNHSGPCIGTQAPDMVAHPPHYTSSPAKCHDCGATIECYWVTEHLPFSLGSAVKYIWRRLHKGSALEDLRKARQYLTFEIEKLEREARQ